jgi:hypothetical protein
MAVMRRHKHHKIWFTAFLLLIIGAACSDPDKNATAIPGVTPPSACYYQTSWLSRTRWMRNSRQSMDSYMKLMKSMESNCRAVSVCAKWSCGMDYWLVLGRLLAGLRSA